MRKAWIGGAIVVMLIQFAFAADDYSQWMYCRDVVLNTKVSGAGVANPVLRFPVLVRLGAADSLVFKNAQANGQDIRFSKYDGTHFRYQIDQWNAATRAAAIWVLADSVRGNDSSAYMKMYWGNSAAADSQNGTAVFDTANGFAAVYHLGEAGGNAPDASANGCTATPTAGHTAAERVPGMIDSAQSFTGSATTVDNLNAGSPAGLSIASNMITVSAWVDHTGNGNNAWEGIATKYAWNGNVNYRCFQLALNNSSMDFSWHISSDGTSANETIVYSTTATVNNTWYFVTGAMDGSSMWLYVNGALIASTMKTAMYNSANAPFRIATGDNNQAFHGIIDEVTVSRVARDSNWVKLCYQNQKGAPLPAQTLVSLGQVRGNLSITSQPQSQWVVAGANASFTVSAMGQSPISYRWISGTDTVGTASTLTLTAVQAAANNSVYTCLVSNPMASLMSNPCTLYVASAPVIRSQPASQTVLAGSNASFSVTAIGVAPLSYKWVLSPYNTAADTVGSAATLTLTSVQASADNSIYKCVVRNSAGSTSSNPCTLHVVVLPPPPAIVSPAPNAMINADSVVFRWNKGSYNASAYQLQIAVDSAMTNVIYQDSMTDTTMTMQFAFSTKSYWFRVEAYNSAGWGVFSAKFKFTITTTSALPGRSAAAASFGVSVNGNELRYSLPRAGGVCVKLYDIAGRLVATPVRGVQGAGSYRAPLAKLTAGPYVMTFEADGFAQRRTIVIP